jgi:hypothetical protein
MVPDSCARVYAHSSSTGSEVGRAVRRAGEDGKELYRELRRRRRHVNSGLRVRPTERSSHRQFERYDQNGGSAVTGYVVRALRMSATGTVLATTTSAVQPASARHLTMTPQTGN